jgi:hypothetical protein
MPFSEKTFFTMTDEGTIYCCCGLIYLKKKLSACVMLQKREGLLVVRSLWSRWKKKLERRLLQRPKGRPRKEYS